MRALLVVILAIVLSACGGDQPALEPTPGAGGGPPAEGGESADGEDAVADDLDEADFVTLQTDGLSVTAGDSSQSLVFSDTERNAATEAVAAVLGEPTAEESGLECGPGPLDSVTWQGLDLYFSDGVLAGWYLDEPQPEQVITAGNVVVGSTRGQLKTALPDLSVEESTIGTEWSGGGLSGVLSGDAKDATVEAMWAGANCIAR